MTQPVHDEAVSLLMPPDHPNYSESALRAAYVALDDETRVAIDADRARLRLETGVATFALSEALGLDEHTVSALKAALEIRLTSMSPEYHSYVNNLLGHAAVAIGVPLIAEHTGIEVEASTLDVPAASLAESTGEGNEEPVADAVAADDTDADITLLPQAPNPLDESGEKLEADVAIAVEETLQAPTDAELAEALGIKLHTKTSSTSYGFLEKVFAADVATLRTLNPEEIGLLGWGLIHVFETSYIPRFTPPIKVKHVERFSLLFGHTGPMLNQLTIADVTGVQFSTISKGFTNCAEHLSKLVGADARAVLELARNKATDLVQANTLPTDDDMQPDNGARPDMPSQAGVGENGAAENALTPGSALLYDHYRGTPAGMQNFLISCFLPKETADIEGLTSMQATWLASQIIETYKSMLARAGKNPAVINKHSKILERLTGIYTQAEDAYLIGQRMAMPTQSVKQSYEAALKSIETKVGRETLLGLLQQVATLTERDLRPLIRTS